MITPKLSWVQTVMFSTRWVAGSSGGSAVRTYSTHVSLHYGICWRQILFFIEQLILYSSCFYTLFNMKTFISAVCAHWFANLWFCLVLRKGCRGLYQPVIFLFLPPEQLWQMFAQLKLQSAKHYLSTLSKADRSRCSFMKKSIVHFQVIQSTFLSLSLIHLQALVHLSVWCLFKSITDKQAGPSKVNLDDVFSSTVTLTRVWVSCLSPA